MFRMIRVSYPDSFPIEQFKAVLSFLNELGIHSVDFQMDVNNMPVKLIFLEETARDTYFQQVTLSNPSQSKEAMVSLSDTSPFFRSKQNISDLNSNQIILKNKEKEIVQGLFDLDRLYLHALDIVSQINVPRQPLKSKKSNDESLLWIASTFDDIKQYFYSYI